MCYKHELARYKGIVEEKLFAIVDGLRRAEGS